jgi:hypothetical protein
MGCLQVQCLATMDMSMMFIARALMDLFEKFLRGRVHVVWKKL